MMALSNQVVNLYSDLLIHGMGPGLADDILQGRAAGDEFRTAPLWGLSQRIFFIKRSSLTGAPRAPNFLPRRRTRSSTRFSRYRLHSSN